MTTDTFFTIGKSHTICQDYADQAHDHVIICDGCSTAPESNIGAILLSRAAKLFLKKFPFQDEHRFTQSVLLNAYACARAMELHEDSLLATLLMAKVVESNFKVVISGDGVVVARYRGTNNWKVCEYTYPSGAPFYLRYTLDPIAKANYVHKFGISIKQHVFEIDCDTKECVEVFSAVFEKNPSPYCLDFPLAEYDMVAIFSDGVSSFLKTETKNTSRQTINVPLCQILLEVLSFKNYAGAFVQRRCRAAFKKFYEDSTYNFDDFSMGVIRSNAIMSEDT